METVFGTALTVDTGGVSLRCMDAIEKLSKLYAERGAPAAEHYCVRERLIGSICMTCARVYRLVNSHRRDGGISHGWCSENCASTGIRLASETGIKKVSEMADAPQ